MPKINNFTDFKLLPTIEFPKASVKKDMIPERHLCNALDKLKGEIECTGEISASAKFDYCYRIYSLAYAMYHDVDEWQKFCAMEFWRGKRQHPQATAESKSRAILYVTTYIFEGHSKTSMATTFRKMLKPAWSKLVPPCDVGDSIRDVQNAGKAAADKRRADVRKRKADSRKLISDIEKFLGQQCDATEATAKLRRRRRHNGTLTNWKLYPGS